MTSFGINNEGQLIYDYFHEDSDQLDGANVYNGQNSVLWTNFRNAFQDEIKATYQELRSTGILNYDELIDQFITKGSDKWSESIYNEDADFKYISMLYSDNDATNLWQVRGTGEEHFRYFVENRINYCDSKWYAADYADDYILLRIYTPMDENGLPRTDLAVPANANITVIPFSHMYAGVRYKANGTLQQERVGANELLTFEAPNETFNNTETAIYGASQLSSLVDLSPLYCGGINVSKATKLTELIIGNGTEGYSNPNLIDLSVGTNELLKVINIQNCPNLTDPLALSGCPNIEEIYAAGSGITGVELANSGYLKTIELPATITNLTLKNQLYIESLTLEGYEAIKTINIENCPTVASLDILGAATNVERVRLTNVDWSYYTVEDVLALSERNLAGIDENGNNTDKMWIDGKCHIKTLTGADYLKVKEAFPYMTITYDNLTAVLTYMSEDGGEKLHEEIVVNGGDGVATVVESDNLINIEECTVVDSDYLLTPKIEVTPNTKYYTNICRNLPDGSVSWAQKWYAYREDGTALNSQGSDLQDNLLSDTMGTRTTTVNEEGVYFIQVKFHKSMTNPYWGLSGILPSGDIITPTKPSTAQYDFTFGGWSLSPNSEPNENALKNVEADRTVYAAFTQSLRKYTVKFYNGTTLLETKTVEYGSDATYTGATPVHPTAPDDCEFRAWSPEPTNIKGDTNCYAQWYDRREITDSWETIAAACLNGTATDKYAIGAFKMLDIGVKDLPIEFGNGSAVLYNNEIHILGSSASAYRTSHYKWTGTEWVEVSTLPYEFYYGSAVVYNNEIHIFGGSGGTKKHYKWDGSSWTSVSTLPYKFSEGIAIVYNNEIHIMGSNDSSNYTSHYKWNGSAWSEVGNLPYSFYTASGFIYNNEIHVLGSYDSNYETAHYKYDGSSWTSVSTLPQKLSNGHALVVGTDIYMIQWDEFYKYDGTSWSTVPEVPANVYEGCSVVLDGVIYVMGSSVSGNRKVFFSYTPETETWSKVGITESIPMEVIAHNHDELADGIRKWKRMTYIPDTVNQGGISKYIVYKNEIHALGQTSHYKWTGTEWVSVSTIPYSFYGSVVIYKDELHILGSNSGNYNHYKWNETDGWIEVSTLPHPINGTNGLVVYNDEIHVWGFWQDMTNHYKWNETDGWVYVSKPGFYAVTGKAFVYDGKIYAPQATSYRCWDGSKWTTAFTWQTNLGNSFVYDDELYLVFYRDATLYKYDGTDFIRVCALPSYISKENVTPNLIVYSNNVYIVGTSNYTYRNIFYKWSGPSWEKVSVTNTGGVGNYTGIDACMTPLDNKIYFHNNKTLFTFDGSSTAKIGSMPTVGTNKGCAVYNGSFYNFRYDSDNSQFIFYKLDGSTWTEVLTNSKIYANGNFNICGVEYDGKLHIFSSGEHYTWDGTDVVWIGTIGRNMSRGSGIIHNGCIYILCHETNKYLMKYDGSTWTEVANLGFYENGRASMASYGDKLHIIYGYTHHTVDASDNVVTLASLPIKSMNGLACTIKGRLYFGFGQTSVSTDFVRTYKNPRATLTFLAKNALSELMNMNDWNRNNDGWTRAPRRLYLNDTFIKLLPNDLQTSLKEVIKISDIGSTGIKLVKTNDKVWLASADELGNDRVYLYTPGQGEPYSVFTNDSSRIKYKNNGTITSWWLRSSPSWDGYFYHVKTNGVIDKLASRNTIGVVPGFCI